MELKYKKKKDESIITKYSVPVSNDMKRKLDSLKSKVDVNAMARDFFNQLLSTAENE